MTMHLAFQPFRFGKLKREFSLLLCVMITKKKSRIFPSLCDKNENKLKCFLGTPKLHGEQATEISAVEVIFGINNARSNK